MDIENKDWAHAAEVPGQPNKPTAWPPAWDEYGQFADPLEGPAFGQRLDMGVLFAPGLTRLEYTAIHVFAALHASDLKLPGDRMADYAVAQARVMLARLENEQGKNS